MLIVTSDLEQRLDLREFPSNNNVMYLEACLARRRNAHASSKTLILKLKIDARGLLNGGDNDIYRR